MGARCAGDAAMMASASSGDSHSLRRRPCRMVSNTGSVHQPRMAACRRTARTGVTTSRMRVASADPDRSKASAASSSRFWSTWSQPRVCRCVSFRKPRNRFIRRLVSSERSRLR